ncbi:hypothetical protein FQZ97_1268210 [compost metagenome]
MPTLSRTRTSTRATQLALPDSTALPVNEATDTVTVAGAWGAALASAYSRRLGEPVPADTTLFNDAFSVRKLPTMAGVA